MYSKIKKISYLLIFITIVILSSCGDQNIEQKIVGTWEVESATLINTNEMLKVHKEMIGEEQLKGISDDEIIEGIKKDFTSEIKGSEIMFGEDKKITLEGHQGEWKMFDNETVIAKNGTREFYFIVNKIDNSKLNFELVIKDKKADIRLDINCKKK